MLQNRRRHLLPPSGVAPARELGSASGSVITSDYAGLNSVAPRNMACMMMASRRARAIRALRMVERFAMANAQSLSLEGLLAARQHGGCDEVSAHLRHTGWGVSFR
jgi:hypothetical protein